MGRKSRHQAERIAEAKREVGNKVNRFAYSLVFTYLVGMNEVRNSGGERV